MKLFVIIGILIFLISTATGQAIFLGDTTTSGATPVGRGSGCSYVRGMYQTPSTYNFVCDSFRIYANNGGSGTDNVGVSAHSDNYGLYHAPGARIAFDTCLVSSGSTSWVAGKNGLINDTIPPLTYIWLGFGSPSGFNAYYNSLITKYKCDDCTNSMPANPWPFCAPTSDGNAFTFALWGHAATPPPIPTSPKKLGKVTLGKSIN
jgi:hypothetical protein